MRGTLSHTVASEVVTNGVVISDAVTTEAVTTEAVTSGAAPDTFFRFDETPLFVRLQHGKPHLLHPHPTTLFMSNGPMVVVACWLLLLLLLCFAQARFRPSTTRWWSGFA